MLDGGCSGISEDHSAPGFLVKYYPGAVASEICSGCRLLVDDRDERTGVNSFFHENSRAIGVDPSDDAQLVVLVTFRHEHDDRGSDDHYGHDCNCYDFLIQEITGARIYGNKI